MIYIRTWPLQPFPLQPVVCDPVSRRPDLANLIPHFRGRPKVEVARKSHRRGEIANDLQIASRCAPRLDGPADPLHATFSVHERAVLLIRTARREKHRPK